MVELELTIPEEFYKEEVRCGYTISSQQKCVWAVELDLLNKLQKVCEKHHLTVMADSGTLLGAVRHNGFIPWDDDIDLSMPREDYNKLCELASSEFDGNYFFQTDFTDPGSCRGHAQLRNSATAAILQSEQGKNLFFNQGIFIDIFPFDNIPDDLNARNKWFKIIEKYRRLSRLYRNLFFNSYGVKGLKQIPRTLMNRWVHLRTPQYRNKYYEKREILKQKYDNCPTKAIGNLFGPSVDFTINNWDRSIFESAVKMKFEMLEINVPVQYERYLNESYGNWHEFVKGGTIHSEIIFDVNKSYKEYLK